MTSTEKVWGSRGWVPERGFWLAIVLASCAIDERDVDTGSAPQFPARGGSGGGSGSTLGGSGGTDLQLEPDGGAGAEGPVDDMTPIVPGSGGSSGSGGSPGSGATSGSGGSSGADPSMPVTDTQVELVLSLSGTGQGAVRVDPPGVSCDQPCTQTYTAGSTLTLTPTAELGSSFVGWSAGPCTGAGLCVLTASADVEVEAQFNLLPPQPLSVVLGGNGRIVSSPGGIDYPGTCSATFVSGTRVILTANPIGGTGDYFEGWTGQCSGFDTCFLTLDAARSVGASFGPANLVFVTSTLTFPGSFGGLAGADAICQQRARAGGLVGRYVAWLSTSAINAEARLAGARGWVRSDGLEVADTARGLTNFEMFHPVRLDEFGTDVQQTLAATGTSTAGLVVPGGTCNDWTDPTGSYDFGSSDNLGAFFVSGGNNLCNVQSAALYCFGVDREVRVVPRRFSGRIAFVSEGTFTPGGGIAVADALCQSEATAAGLPGTYLAELATSTSLPQARFDLSGPPWVRPDGVLLELSAESYFSVQYSRSAPIVGAAGGYFGFGRNWLGLTNARTTSAESTCQDWTSNTLATGIVSTVGNTDNPGSAFQGSPCSFPGPVICLQR